MKMINKYIIIILLSVKKIVIKKIQTNKIELNIFKFKINTNNTILKMLHIIIHEL